jgi:hypothetical protein
MMDWNAKGDAIAAEKQVLLVMSMLHIAMFEAVNAIQRRETNHGCLHPEYPCAHCIVSAAISTVLRNVIGDEFGEFSLTSPTAPGVVRKWSRLQDYSDEVVTPRIYAGFHYRFSTEVGKDMGEKVGELTVATQLRGLESSADPKR